MVVATTVLSGKEVLELEKAFAKYAKKIKDENDKLNYVNKIRELKELWQMYDPALMVLITRQIYEILQRAPLNAIEHQTLNNIYNLTHESLLKEKEYTPTERARIMIAFQSELQIFGEKDSHTQAKRTWRTFTSDKATEPTDHHRTVFGLAVIKTDHSVVVKWPKPSISNKFYYEQEKFALINECLAHPKMQPPGPVTITGLRYSEYCWWNPFQVVGNSRILDLAKDLTKAGYEVAGVGLMTKNDQKILKELQAKYEQFTKKVAEAEQQLEEEKSPPEAEVGKHRLGPKP
jgi:hypothetical protein